MLPLLIILFLVNDHASANLTHCLQYISCMDFAHANLRQCVGSTALALALEAKEQTFARFMTEHENATQICQEKLASDSFDFEVLQLLVNDDAHRCFIHLSKNHRLSDTNVKDCSWNTLSLKSQSRSTPFACLTIFRSARDGCEKLLQCCPEHSRCAERLNTFSVAYQEAKDKVHKILQRLLLCLASEHSLAFPEVVAMQANSMRSRIAGVPFFKPDTSTEQRISRRLNLMSYSTMLKRTTERRKKIHAKRFQQARKLLELTLSPQNNKDRLTTVKNLSRNELPLYASLTAEGNFAKLVELERKKTASSLKPHPHVHDAAKAALLSKGVKTVKPHASPLPTVAGLYLRPPPQRKERRRSWLAIDQNKNEEERTTSNRTLKEVLLDESSKSICNSEAASQKLDKNRNVQRLLDWKASDTFLQERAKPVVKLSRSKIYKVS
ncbi:unnamed protein product [Cylicocyclus nassatus]|uniref:Uncharacterized protein n=1 Tax=Cylicocyclus nassatus TaxID=53992 RepID=A0AA36HBJ7_CYLNA|nr:unnamed protein product [Cylicocyclus nassatus]